jgi:hypothetical protein
MFSRTIVLVFVLLGLFGCSYERRYTSAPPPPAPAGSASEGHGYPKISDQPAPPSPETATEVAVEQQIRIPVKTVTKNNINSNPLPQSNSTLDSLQSQLYSASIAFVVPEKANIEERVQVQLLIDPNELSSALEERLTVEGEKYSGNIKVSKLVQAKLVASGFDISNVTPETQPITMDGSTEWIWLLIPKEVGVQKVFLTINAIVEIDEKETQRQIKTYEKELSIEISRKQKIQRWFDGNWQWAWGALIAPIIGLLWAQTRKKKKKR